MAVEMLLLCVCIVRNQQSRQYWSRQAQSYRRQADQQLVLRPIVEMLQNQTRRPPTKHLPRELPAEIRENRKTVTNGTTPVGVINGDIR